mgnify:CR=1 FL=1
MAISQIVWSLDEKKPLPLDSLLSEKELEDLLCDHIEILNNNWLVIGRQVKTSAGKYIDLLCMDRDGDIVIIELKKDLTPREVTAQVIDYASCVSELKLEEIAEQYLQYSQDKQTLNQAYESKFGSKLDEDAVNKTVKMVIVATKMDDSTERIITYLRDTYQVDINILFFSVFQHNSERLISHVWFQNDQETQLPSACSVRKWNHEYYVSFGSGERKWSDAQKVGFISAGGGSWYTNTLKMLSPGDRVWVNIPHTGYVGVGIVESESQIASRVRFMTDEGEKGFSQLQVDGDYLYSPDDEERAEYVVKVKWLKTVPEKSAVKELGFFGNQNSVCRPTDSKWDFTIERLKALWKIDS